MNFFDYIIIIVILLSTIGSFFRGFAREFMSLVVWVVGIVAALKLAPVLEPHIMATMHWSTMSYVAAFVLIFLSIWLIGLFISLAIRTVLDRVGLGPLDRVIGLAFGFVRGVLLIAVLMMFINASALENSPTIKTSLLAPQFHALALRLTNMIPPDFKKRVSMGWNKQADDATTAS